MSKTEVSASDNDRLWCPAVSRLNTPGEHFSKSVYKINYASPKPVLLNRAISAHYNVLFLLYSLWTMQQHENREIEGLQAVLNAQACRSNGKQCNG